MNRTLTVDKVMEVFDSTLDRIGGRTSRDAEIGACLRRTLEAWIQPSITHEMQDRAEATRSKGSVSHTLEEVMEERKA